MTFALGSLLTLALMLSCTTQGGSATSSPSQEVSTFAGSGYPGISNGPVNTASFLFPVGIAVAKNGTIYVSDQSAERIRAISDGVVRTVAGSGALGPEKLSVRGGYKDGPALQAQFNMPAGLVMDRNGGLLIADSNNGCIRQLKQGVVSTVIGKCGDRRVVDGGRDQARLLSPRAMAFDKQGNLYIADFGGGLRKRGTDGSISTVSLTSTQERGYLGIAIHDGPDGETILLSAQNTIVAYYPSTNTSSVLLAARGGTSEEGQDPFGTPGAIAAINHREFIFSDPRANNIRYLRLPAPPYAGTLFSRVIAGGQLERGTENAGFQNGSRTNARFFDPAGVAVIGKRLLVADAGNHRIRVMELPRMLAPESGPADEVPTDDDHYEIAYIGASTTYWDSLADDSICGQLESRLDASRKIRKPVRCHPMRIDGTALPAMQAYISSFVTPRGFNLVVMQLGVGEVSKIDPTGKLAPSAILAKFKVAMTSIRNQLASQKTHLVVLWADNAALIEGQEYFYGRETTPNAREVPADAYDFQEASVPALRAVLGPLDIPDYDIFGATMKYEASLDAKPLFQTGLDMHPSPLGNAFIGRHLANFLLTLPRSKLGLGAEKGVARTHEGKTHL